MTNLKRYPLLASLSLLALAACGDPEPADDPEAKTEASEKTMEEKKTQPPKKTGKRVTPTVKISNGGTRTVSIKARGFAKQMKSLKINDVIEVELRRGGQTRGTIVALSDDLLVITSALPGDDDKNSIETRLRPKQVVSVRFLYRPTKDSTGMVVASGPRNKNESWLERYADGEILGKDPKGLWTGRFKPNQNLLVKRPFKVKTLTFKERTNKAFFTHGTRPTVLYAGDAVKLIGLSLGYRGTAKHDVCLGEVYHYLIRRRQTIWVISSLERLHPGDLERDSLKVFLKREMVTLIVEHPEDPHPIKVRRIPAWKARVYRKHLERTPDRPAIRRLRARGDEKELAKAEDRVRRMYAAMGLTKDEDLDRPLLVRFRLPANKEGGIHLLPYKREIGLD